MKTEISRDSHNARKRYSGVYHQQGRMLADYDWNELVEIVKERLKGVLGDLVDGGAPREGAVEVVKPNPANPLAISPGRAYASGAPAAVVPDESHQNQDPFPFDGQADFPSPPAPPANDYTVYLDVWERSVVALEDEEHLRDPALHGADTTTRTQTIAQVKWWPGTDDPEAIAENPSIGDAPLSLELRSRLVEADPCDPCADTVGLTTRTGNYLFRVEIHEMGGPANAPDRLIVKWSTENAAMHHAATSPDQLPPDFEADEWVYEFYNEVSERHFGAHAPSVAPVVGEIAESYPQTPPVGSTWVRRWDGYCEISRSGGTWSLVRGRDRGIELSEDSSISADGHVALGSDLDIRLHTLRLTLGLDTRSFLTGDYWLAPVREAVQDAGDLVLDGDGPVGIRHQYLRLGRVNPGGSLITPSTEDLRRLNFPPLTDLRAADVGYTTDCPSGLFDATHDTVKKALDRVCSITADQVGFTKPCDTSVYAGVPEASLQTVADALALLCSLNAGQIAYTADPTCTLLQDASTVQEAIDRLCARPTGGGCKVTVGEGGQFLTVREAIEALQSQGERDICICLLPGEHDLGGRLEVSAQINLCIEGCGSASRFGGTGSMAFSRLRSLSLSGFALEKTASAEFGIFCDRCADVRIADLMLTGTIQQRAHSLISIGQASRIRVVRNVLAAVTNLNSGAAVLYLRDGTGTVMIEDNQLGGLVVFYGDNFGLVLNSQERQLLANGIGEGRITLRAGRGRLWFNRNRVSGIQLSTAMIASIRAALNPPGQIRGFYTAAQFSDNSIARDRHQFIALLLNLHGTVFESIGDHGWWAGASTIVLGNTAPSNNATLRSIGALRQNVGNIITVT